MSREVYFISGSPFAWRVMLGLAVKGLEFTGHELHGSKGDQKKPEYLAMNPHGQVPVYKDGNITMYESLAILAFLDRKYPENPLFGETLEEAALAWQRTKEVESHVMTHVGGVVRPVFTGTVDGNEESINEAIGKIKAQLDNIVGWLGENDYLAGGSISAADISLYPALGIFGRIGAMLADNEKLNFDLLPVADKYPAIGAWMKRIEALDGFDAVYPPHWKEKAAA